MNKSGLTDNILCIAILAMLMTLSACGLSTGSGLIEQTFPASGMELSAYGWVGVSFAEDVVEASIEKAFAITPAVSGKIFWQENTLWFRPIQAFAPGIDYQAQLQGEIETAGGRSVKINRTWTFQVREPMLLYFVPQDEGGDIWRTVLSGSDSEQFTFTSGNVLDFTPDRTGEQIAYTAMNQYGGSDVWLMDREGVSQRQLIACGDDVCSEPAWSVDSGCLAYVRQAYDAEAGSYQPAKILTAAITPSTVCAPALEIDLYGTAPSYSPDGVHFAYYDISNARIQILNLVDGGAFNLPSAGPGFVDWSPDGTQIIYTDVAAAHHEPFVAAYIADLDAQTAALAFDEGATDTEFSQPRWSPDGEWVAAGLRPVNSAISKALWVLNLKGKGFLTVADDPTATYSAYQWDPWGAGLVYQQYDLGRSEEQLSIWYWDWESLESRQIIDYGARPIWLP